MTGSIFVLGMGAVSIVFFAVRAILNEERVAREVAVAELGRRDAELRDQAGGRGK